MPEAGQSTRASAISYSLTLRTPFRTLRGRHRKAVYRRPRADTPQHTWGFQERL